MPIETPQGNLDIKNATLRTSNLETQNIKIGSIFVNSYPGLETTANVGNTTSNTIQFTNTHTAFTTTGNVSVGKDLTVTGAASVSNVVTIGTTKTFVVKVGSNGKYEINGVDRPTLQLHQHQTYIFDLSSSTLSGHPFRISETATGDAYDTGITTTGTYGSNEKRTFVVPAGAPTTLYYYCTQHAGMGATMSISSTAELMVSGRVESTDLVVTGTGGSTLGSGTTAQRPANPTLGTIRYNSTTGFMEAYAAVGWAPIAQPPTITGISPLTTLSSGGQAAGFVGVTGAKFTISGGAANDYVGKYSVITGDGTKFVTASAETTNAVNDGAVYTYTYSGGSWGSPVKTQGSDTVNDDSFGSSLAMNRSGTKLLVGQKGWGNTTGYAYLYTYSGGSWGSEVKFSPPSSASVGDGFGTHVAMNDDGTKIIVAAPNDDDKGTDAGAAYIFTYSSGSWDTGTKIVAADGQAGYRFGAPGSNLGPNHMAMSGDGTTVVVGSYKSNTGVGARGAVYVFTYSNSSGSWDLGTKVERGDAADWDSFGHSVAMNADGTQMLVGATGKSNGTVTAGAVYHYIYSNGSWSEQQKIISSDGEATDNFGVAISINYDWTKLIVGAKSEDTPSIGTDTGAAYTFTYNGSTWSQDAKLLAAVIDSSQSDALGSSVTISADGSRVVIGAPFEDTNGTNSGAVYIFDATTEILDSSTQIFTATGTGIVSGSTVQLEGADGSLYSVSNVTPNAAGSQVTFKMGTLGASGAFTIANQPYKVKVNSTSGLTGTSTAAIGFPVGWTSPAAGATLNFNIAATTTHTLVGTDGGGGFNRKFTVVSTGVNALPSPLALTESGVISGQIAANQDGVTTPVTFRLTDTATGLFTDRAVDIVGTSVLYNFTSPFTFTNAGVYGRSGPNLSQLQSPSTGYGTSGTTEWVGNSNFFNVGGFMGGIQLWTVPDTKSYRIAAYGSGSRATNQGGYGARITGTCTLTMGEVIYILVGQTCINATNSASHGGGGGTFVVRSPYNTNASIIVIAGGGGGGHSTYGVAATGNANLGTSGQIGTGGVAGGGSGNAGTSGYDNNQGAGFFTSTGSTASSFTNGGIGGTDNSYGQGGFGGGGRHGLTHGGGGGGYSGGGGSVNLPYVGGGGGSYKATFFTVTSEDQNVHDGPGSVTITEL